MENKLNKLFEYQKFEQNEHLAKLIAETEARHAAEISDDDLALVTAAGDGNVGPVYYIAANDCVDCGRCAKDCPVGAIKELGNIYTIDKEICVNCGVCMGSCPAGAIIYG